jgi:hypothetical protein
LPEKANEDYENASGALQVLRGTHKRLIEAEAEAGDAPSSQWTMEDRVQATPCLRPGHSISVLMPVPCHHNARPRAAGALSYCPNCPSKYQMVARHRVAGGGRSDGWMTPRGRPQGCQPCEHTYLQKSNSGALVRPHQQPVSRRQRCKGAPHGSLQRISIQCAGEPLAASAPV